MTNMCCPHCGNKNIQVTTETNVSTTGKNYSGGKGCLGFLMFGPLGLLCGSCGEGQKTTSTSTTYWVCPNCGHKFESPNDLRNKSNEKRKTIPVMVIVGIIFAVAIYYLVDGVAKGEDLDFPVALVMALFLGVFMGLICPLVISSQANNMNKEADYLEEQMRKFENSQRTPTNTSYYENRVQMPANNSYSNSNLVNNGYTVQPQQSGNVCTGCGTVLSQGVAFCTSCGKKVEASIFCKGCGAVLQENAAFCVKCGTKVDDIATSVPPQMQPTNRIDMVPTVPISGTHNNVPSAPEVSAGANEWKCPQCGGVNQNYVGTCGCGARRP